MSGVKMNSFETTIQIAKEKSLELCSKKLKYRNTILKDIFLKLGQSKKEIIQANQKDRKFAKSLVKNKQLSLALYQRLCLSLSLIPKTFLRLVYNFKKNSIGILGFTSFNNNALPDFMASELICTRTSGRLSKITNKIPIGTEYLFKNKPCASLRLYCSFLIGSWSLIIFLGYCLICSILEKSRQSLWYKAKESCLFFTSDLANFLSF